MNSILKLVWLIPVLPLAGFLINGLGRKMLSKSLSGMVASGSVLGSFIISLLVFFQVKNGQAATIHLFDFATRI